MDAADLTAIRSGMLTTVSDEISTAGGNVTLDGYTVTITAGAYTEPVNVTIVLPAPPESVIASRPPVVYTTVEDLSGNVPDFAGVKRGSQARFQIGLPVSTAGSNATYALAVVDESNNETELETGPFADLTAGLVPVTDALYQAALDAGVAPKKWTAGVQTPLSGAR